MDSYNAHGVGRATAREGRVLSEGAVNYVDFVPGVGHRSTIAGRRIGVEGAPRDLYGVCYTGVIDRRAAISGCIGKKIAVGDSRSAGVDVVDRAPATCVSSRIGAEGTVNDHQPTGVVDGAATHARCVGGERAVVNLDLCGVIRAEDRTALATGRVGLEGGEFDLQRTRN